MNQNHLCYHYTTGLYRSENAIFPRALVKSAFKDNSLEGLLAAIRCARIRLASKGF